VVRVIQTGIEDVQSLKVLRQLARRQENGNDFAISNNKKEQERKKKREEKEDEKDEQEEDGKVDIIISEWMGMMLLRESMLDSLLVARDRYYAYTYNNPTPAALWLCVLCVLCALCMLRPTIT
jgi:hypothetical protein